MIIANPKTFFLGGGEGEEARANCQIVLNKQQHPHDAIIEFNFDH